MNKIQNEDIKALAEVSSVLKLPQDVKICVTAKSLNKTLKQAIEDGDIGGGGAGRFNYFEQATTAAKWTRYKNTTAGSAPDNFGGSPTANLTVTDETTTPLRKSSLKISKINSVNLQGEGLYYETTINEADVATMLDWLNAFKSSSGYVSGDLGIFAVYSTDNFVSDFQVKAFSPQEIAAGQYVKPFPNPQVQTLGSATKVRFCIHVRTTTTNNFDVLIEDLNCGPTQFAFGAAGWPQYNLSVTVTNGNVYRAVGTPYKRTDGSWHISGHIIAQNTGGARTSMDFTVSGITSKNQHQAVTGTFYGGFAPADVYGVIEASTNVFYVINTSSQNYAYGLITFDIELASKPTFAIDYSNIQVSDQSDGRVIASRVYLTGTQSIPNSTATKVNYNGVSFDKNLMWDNTNKRFVVKADGTYEFGGAFQFYRSTSGYTRAANVVKNGGGTPVNLGILSYPQEPTTATDYLRPLPCGEADLVVGDTVEVQVYQDTGGALNLVGNGEAYDHFWIRKASGMTAISAAAKIRAHAQRITSNQTVTAVAVELIFNSVYFADDDSYNPSNGRFTAKKDGVLKVYFNPTLRTGTGSINVQAFALKNGTGTLYGYRIQDDVINGKKYPLSGVTFIPVKKGDYVSIWGSIDTADGELSTYSTVSFELE